MIPHPDGTTILIGPRPVGSATAPLAEPGAACVGTGICPAPPLAGQRPQSGTMFLALGLVVAGTYGLRRLRRPPRPA